MQIFGKAAQFAEPVFSKGHLNDVKKKKTSLKGVSMVEQWINPPHAMPVFHKGASS